MTKTIMLIAGQGSGADLEGWGRSLDDTALTGIEGLSISSAIEPGAYLGMIEVWGESSAVLRSAAAQPGWQVSIWRVRERIESRKFIEREGEVPGLRFVSPIWRREGLDRAQMRQGWNEHVPLALRIHVGCARYVRNWIETPGDGDPDGIAGLTYLTRDDYDQRRYAYPGANEEIAADVRRFAGQFEILLARETIYRLPPGEVAATPPDNWADRNL